MQPRSQWPGPRFCAGLHVFLLCREHLADGIQGVDLCADVAILRGNIGDGRIEVGQRSLSIGLVGQIGGAQALACVVGVANGRRAACAVCVRGSCRVNPLPSGDVRNSISTVGEVVLDASGVVRTRRV